MLRKLAPGVAILFIVGVACSKTTPTTSTVIASPPPTPSPSVSASPSLSQQQAVSLISAMTTNVDNLNQLSNQLTAKTKGPAKHTATQIFTSMSQLRASISAYKQANWDSTGQLFAEFEKWVRATFSFSNDVQRSSGTSEYNSWSKKSTELATEGDSLKKQIATATGLAPTSSPSPSPSAYPSSAAYPSTTPSM
jgi:hypothetical protein